MDTAINHGYSPRMSTAVELGAGQLWVEIVPVCQIPSVNCEVFNLMAQFWQMICYICKIIRFSIRKEENQYNVTNELGLFVDPY